MAAFQELRQQKEFLEADRSKLWTVAGKGQRREALGFIGGLLDRDGKPQAPKPYTTPRGKGSAFYAAGIQGLKLRT